jgi:hypothetical protein
LSGDDQSPLVVIKIEDQPALKARQSVAAPWPEVLITGIIVAAARVRLWFCRRLELGLPALVFNTDRSHGFHGISSL